MTEEPPRQPGRRDMLGFLTPTYTRYFFTVNLAERSGRLLVDRIARLRDAPRIVKHRHPLHIDAMVVLPDHAHAIWTLPPGDVDYPMLWMLIKAGFSRRLPKGERIRIILSCPFAFLAPL